MVGEWIQSTPIRRRYVKATANLSLATDILRHTPFRQVGEDGGSGFRKGEDFLSWRMLGRSRLSAVKSLASGVAYFRMCPGERRVVRNCTILGWRSRLGDGALGVHLCGVGPH